MNKIQRILVALAIVSVALTYFFPLWEISLFAPQYPEGLRLNIWINQIAGDVHNINILNHYIGMKHITPDSIPELKLMPILVGAIMAIGLLPLITGNKKLLVTWAILYLALAFAGLYDFYQWEYMYGHDLSPDAPIKVPGMTYQPPLIGKETLLNISAYSLPDVGGWGLIISITLAWVAVFWNLIEKKLFSRKTAASAAVLAVVALVGLTGCTSQKAQPIVYGSDICDQCKMKISDQRFGAEIVSDKGKAYKFDSLDCLISFRKEHSEITGKTYTADFFKAGELVDVEKATFLQSDAIHGPMGTGIASSADRNGLKETQKGQSGKVMEWKEVENFLASSSK